MSSNTNEQTSELVNIPVPKEFINEFKLFFNNSNNKEDYKFIFNLDQFDKGSIWSDQNMETLEEKSVSEKPFGMKTIDHYFIKKDHLKKSLSSSKRSASNDSFKTCVSTSNNSENIIEKTELNPLSQDIFNDSNEVNFSDPETSSSKVNNSINMNTLNSSDINKKHNNSHDTSNSESESEVTKIDKESNSLKKTFDKNKKISLRLSDKSSIDNYFKKTPDNSSLSVEKPVNSLKSIDKNNSNIIKKKSKTQSGSSEESDSKSSNSIVEITKKSLSPLSKKANLPIKDFESGNFYQKNIYSDKNRFDNNIVKDSSVGNTMVNTSKCNSSDSSSENDEDNKEIMNGLTVKISKNTINDKNLARKTKLSGTDKNETSSSDSDEKNSSFVSKKSGMKKNTVIRRSDTDSSEDCNRLNISAQLNKGKEVLASKNKKIVKDILGKNVTTSRRSDTDSSEADSENEQLNKGKEVQADKNKKIVNDSPNARRNKRIISRSDSDECNKMVDGQKIGIKNTVNPNTNTLYEKLSIGGKNLNRDKQNDDNSQSLSDEEKIHFKNSDIGEMLGLDKVLSARNMSCSSSNSVISEKEDNKKEKISEKHIKSDKKMKKSHLDISLFFNPGASSSFTTSTPSIPLSTNPRDSNLHEKKNSNISKSDSESDNSVSKSQISAIEKPFKKSLKRTETDENLMNPLDGLNSKNVSKHKRKLKLSDSDLSDDATVKKSKAIESDKRGEIKIQKDSIDLKSNNKIVTNIKPTTLQHLVEGKSLVKAEERLALNNCICLEDISSEDEVYTLQCPKELDIISIVGKKVSLGGESLFDGLTKDKQSMKFETFAMNIESQINLLLPSKAESSYKLGSYKVNGSIIVSEHFQLPEVDNSSVVSSAFEEDDDGLDVKKTPLPKGLKLRHPLYGLDYAKGKLPDFDAVTMKEKGHKKKKKEKHAIDTVGEEFRSPCLPLAKIGSSSDKTVRKPPKSRGVVIGRNTISIVSEDESIHALDGEKKKKAKKRKIEMESIPEKIEPIKIKKKKRQKTDDNDDARE